MRKEVMMLDILVLIGCRSQEIRRRKTCTMAMLDSKKTEELWRVMSCLEMENQLMLRNNQVLNLKLMEQGNSIAGLMLK